MTRYDRATVRLAPRFRLAESSTDRDLSSLPIRTPET
jgi:hypothetical protein